MPSLASFSSRIIPLFPSCSPQVHSPACIVSWKGPRAFLLHFPCLVNGHTSTVSACSFHSVAQAVSSPAKSNPCIASSSVVAAVSGIEMLLPGPSVRWTGEETLYASSSSCCVEADPCIHTRRFSVTSCFVEDSGLLSSCNSNMDVCNRYLPCQVSSSYLVTIVWLVVMNTTRLLKLGLVSQEH